MEPTPEAAQELQRLTHKAEGMARGMARHGIPMEAKIEVHDDQSIHVHLQLGGEGWLTLCEMLVTYLDGKERAREVRDLSVAPGPEGFQ